MLDPAHNLQLAEQLEAQANSEVQLKRQKASLEKALLSKETALQTTLEEVKARCLLLVLMHSRIMLLTANTVAVKTC